MKIRTIAFQLKEREEYIEFTNYDNVDDILIFNEVMERLKQLPDVVVGRKRIGPWEDYYICKLDGNEFTVYYDIDYGDVTIYAESKMVRDRIFTLFSEECL